MREALRTASPILLEPMMKLEVVVPDDYFGDVLANVNSRRGMVMGSDVRGNTQIINAIIPLAETFGYTTDLRSLTQGRGTASMEFARYEQVPASVAEEITRRIAGEAAAV